MSDDDYNSTLAGEFWSRRLRETDPLSAVLTYDAPRIINQLYDTWERKSLQAALKTPPEGLSVIDIGAGVGRIAIPLAREGAEVNAVDISAGMIEQLRLNCSAEGLNSHINAAVSSSTSLPFPDHTFDLVICFGLLEHLPDTPRKETVREMMRVCGERGRIFTVVNNEECVLLARRYGQTQQRDDGYFVSIVGLKWLHDAIQPLSREVRVLSSNPFYALAHYHIYPQCKTNMIPEEQLDQFCYIAEQLDANGGLPDDVIRRLASHFLVELIPTKET